MKPNKYESSLHIPLTWFDVFIDVSVSLGLWQMRIYKRIHLQHQRFKMPQMFAQLPSTFKDPLKWETVSFLNAFLDNVFVKTMKTFCKAKNCQICFSWRRFHPKIKQHYLFTFMSFQWCMAYFQPWKHKRCFEECCPFWSLTARGQFDFIKKTVKILQNIYFCVTSW